MQTGCPGLVTGDGDAFTMEARGLSCHAYSTASRGRVRDGEGWREAREGQMEAVQHRTSHSDFAIIQRSGDQGLVPWTVKIGFVNQMSRIS